MTFRGIYSDAGLLEEEDIDRGEVFTFASKSPGVISP